MRLTVLLVLLAGLTGCASMTTQSGNEAGLTDVRAKIALGRCDDGLVTSLSRSKAPELEQEAAYICLQQGKLEAVEQLLKDYTKRHPNGPHPDYSAYLMALAQQVRFELTETDELARIREGRITHQRYADFVRSYPESEYRSEVGPRLNTLLEDMASTEYRLALKTAGEGDMQTAQARMSYIVRYYPHSRVVRDVNDWLGRVGTGQDNTAPGSAWQPGN